MLAVGEGSGAIGFEYIRVTYPQSVDRRAEWWISALLSTAGDCYGRGPASPAAEYGNRAGAGPMREPAIQTAPDREDRNATGGGISLLAQTDAVALAARAARSHLEALLNGADLPELPVGYADAAERYVELLLAANARLNLTRVVEPEAVARLHLLDALAGLRMLDALAPSTALDLGSGGGVPGIPLGLARPDVRWTLVDSVAKKADTLRGFVESLGLRNVEVVAERAETLGRLPAHRERHDLVAARACAALPVLAELALPLLTVGGCLLAWKGPLTDADDEFRRGRSAAAQLGGASPDIRPSLPALGGHTFVLVSKERQTPERYPRRPGEPARRPLA
jgi:16S rRNA (guanine527-N7)-methyltransferase